MKELWPQYHSFPLDKYNAHPCSFVDVFGTDKYAAANYCRIWSRIVAADMFQAFQDVMHNPEDIRKLGYR